MILEAINQASRLWAQRTAMVIDGQSYSYSQLFSIVDQVYSKLANIDSGVIGIVSGNNIGTYASILAVLYAGKTYVILSPDFPEQRNREISRQAAIGHVITPSGLEPNNDATYYAPEPVATCANAYIIFTSGSTGHPKGVPISRANLDAFYQAYSQLGWKLDEHDRMLQMFKLTFDVSVVSFLYPLTLGASVYTVPDEGFKYANVLDVLDTYHITFAAVAPSVLRLSRPFFDRLLLPHLKYMVVTTEATEASLIADFKSCIPNAQVVNLYGPTECTIYCTAYFLPTQGSPKQHNGLLCIGRPLKGMKSLIIDENGKLANHDEKGELLMSGPQVMSGYLNDASKTQEAMTWIHGTRYYRTGDICYYDESGEIYCLGRKDMQVKIQGYRIDLGEIESRAKAYFMGKRNAVMVAVKCSGQLTELHLVVEGKPCDPVGVMHYLAMHVASYMMPKQVHFIDTFPLNANSKIDRNKIKEIIIS